MPAWFILMLPQLIAGLGKLISSRSALNKQNIYNSPVEQISRLRAAGLPYAAFEAGQAGSQSQLPDLSGFDNLGSAVGTGINQGNQMRMFEELLRKASADADVAGNLRDVSNEITDFELESRDGPFGSMSNARYQKKLEVEMKEQGFWVQKFQLELIEIDRLIKASRFETGDLMKQADAEFDKLIIGNKLANQLWESNDAKNKAFQRIIDTMEGSDGKLGFVEALLIQLISSLSGGAEGGGMKIGF